MDTAYFYLTSEGKALVEKLASVHPGDIYGKAGFKEKLQKAFGTYENLVCVMATGIVVRILAPLIVHKASDPAVVVLDQKGHHAISLLSGHLGGANDLARELAMICGGDPVITTATDVAGELSFDSFAKAHGMAIENIGQLKHVSGALLEGKPVYLISKKVYEELKQPVKDGKLLYLDIKEKMHADSADVEDADTFGVVEKESSPMVVIDEGLTLPEEEEKRAVLYLRPRTICAGIGCKRDMDQAPIEEALRTVLKEEGLSPLSLKCISTIPLKADEPGIIGTAKNLNVPLKIVSTEEIEKLDIESLGIASSDFVAKQTGVLSVSTASSYLSSGKGMILRDKVKFKGITVALSKCTW